MLCLQNLRISLCIFFSFALMLQPQCILASESQVPSLMINSGHTLDVNSLVFSPDGKMLVSGGGDPDLIVWDLATGLPLRKLSGHAREVRQVAISHDGRLIASASRDGTLKIWDAASGTVLRTLSGHSNAVRSLAFNQDSTVIVSGGDDETVRIWNVSTGQEIAKLPTQTDGSIAFSPVGKIVAVGGDDGTLQLWQVDTKQKLSSLPGRNDHLVTDIRFTKDGKTVVFAGADNALKLYDIASGKLVHSLTGHTKEVISIAISPNGKTLASAGDENVKLWDLATGKELRDVTEDDPVETLAFDSSGTILATATRSNGIDLWNPNNGHKTRVISAGADPVDFITVSSDGKKLACSAALGRMAMWDLQSGRQLYQIPEYETQKSILDEKSEKIERAVFSPDGSVLFMVSNRLVKVLSAATGELLTSTPCQRVFHLASSGEFLAWAGDDSITLWRYEDKRTLELKGHSNTVRSIAFSPDGTKLVSGSADQTIRMWDTATGKELAVFTGHGSSVDHIAFCPDGKTVVGCDENTIKVWDTTSGQELRSMKGDSQWMFAFAVSPDGKTAVSAGNDGQTIAWDLNSGTRVKTISEYGDPIVSFAFRPDGKTLFCGRSDGSIKVVRTRDYEELCTLVSFKTGSAVVDKLGRFDSNSLDDMRAISWTLPGPPPRAMPLEVFMKQYYTPRLMLRLLAGNKIPPPPGVEGLNQLQPVVTVKKVVARPNRNDLVDVTVDYKSVADSNANSGKQSGVFNLRLFRDGQLVASLPESQSHSDGNKDLTGGVVDKWFSHTFTVPLSNDSKSKDFDRVKFTAYAFNSDKVKSVTSRFDYSSILRTFSNVKKRGTAYVIAFGVNTYEDPNWNLRYAAADARCYRNLQPALISSGEFNRVVFVPLVSDVSTEKDELPATKSAFRAVLEALGGKPSSDDIGARLKALGVEKAGPDDMVLLSFSCHGDEDTKSGEYFLFPADIGRKTSGRLNDQLKSHAISSSELTDWLQYVDAGDMSLIIDACHSAASTGKDFNGGPMDSPGLGQLAYYKQMRILSACQAEGVAMERHELGHGLLTYALLVEGLKQHRADVTPENGTITLEKLLRYAVEEVPRLDALPARSVGTGDSGTPADKSKTLTVLYDSVPDSSTLTSLLQKPSLVDFSRRGSGLVLFEKRRAPNLSLMLAELNDKFAILSEIETLSLKLKEADSDSRTKIENKIKELRDRPEVAGFTPSQQRKDLMKRAFLYNLSGDWRSALRDTEVLLKGLKAYNDSTEGLMLYQLQGFAYYQGNEFAKARDCYQKCLSLEAESDSAPIWVALASMSIDERDYSGAKKSLDKAISLDPSIAESYVMMTAVCLQQNDSVGADKAIADGLKRLPQNPFLLFTVASLKYQQKDTNGALKAVSEILSLHPDHAMTYTFDAQIQTQLKNWAAVKKDLDSLLSLERPIPSALDFVSLLNYKLNSVDRYKTLIQRANVNRELGDFQSALSDAKDAIKLKSGEASGYFELARSTYLLEKFEDACDAADSCVRLSRYLDQDMYFLQALASLAAMKPSATQFARNRFQWIIEHYNGSTFEPESNQSFLSAVYLLLMDKSRSDKSAQDELSPEVLKRLSEIPAGKWPSPMRDFLQGKIDEKQLYAAADTDLKRSQLHCMLGLKYFFEKRMSIANQQFEWVCKNSKKSCDEYPICQSYSRILTKKK